MLDIALIGSYGIKIGLGAIATICGGVALDELYRIYKSEKLEDEVIIDNIVKYEYVPIGDFIELKNKNVINYQYVEGEKEGIRACVGKKFDDDLKYFDMLNGNTMIGGASQWGKSSFLNTFITSIMLTYTPREVCFIGCDYTESDITLFADYKHFKGMSINKKGLLEQLDFVEDKIKERTKIFKEAGCKNIKTYNANNDLKMSYVIFVIDELVQIVRDKEVKERLHDIMCKSQKYGIHFLLSSQDWTKEIAGRCKMNCNQIVGFTTFDETDSNTIIGKNQNLQDIQIKGRCKIKNCEGVEEVQIFYLENDEIKERLKHLKKDTI